MVQAKVKADSRWAVVTAGGLEFVRSEWRNVPPGLVAEAAANPFLELNETAQEAPSAPEIETAPVSVTIDTSDGVQPAEASAAGRVLQQTPKNKAKKGKH